MRWYIRPLFHGIYSVIFVPKIAGIAQLFLKLLLVVDWLGGILFERRLCTNSCHFYLVKCIALIILDNTLKMDAAIKINIGGFDVMYFLQKKYLYPIIGYTQYIQ